MDPFTDREAYRMLMHEVGHAIGLRDHHMPENMDEGTVMYKGCAPKPLDTILAFALYQSLHSAN